LRTFAWSPDGRKAVINGWSNDLTVYSLDSKASTSYEDLERDGFIYMFGSMWSPDGQELWYEHMPTSPDSGRSLKALDLATGQVRELFTLMDAGGISWSTDGRTMASVRPGSVRGAAEIVVAETGKTDGRVVAALPGSDGIPLNRLAPPQLSAQGDKVLYVVQRPPASAGRGGAIWVVGADGAGARRVAAVAHVMSATWDPSGRFIAYTGKVEGSANTVLRVIDLESGAEHDMPVPSTESRLHLQDWSRDGRFIGFVRRHFWWEYWAVDNLLGEK
jgi:Tol biopolymer transport system component